MNKVADIRRANLRRLVERDTLASVSRRAGKPDRQINDMIAGRKAFGEKVARAIEGNLDPSRPAGWLDTPLDANVLIYDKENVTPSALSSSESRLLQPPCGWPFPADVHKRILKLTPNDLAELTSVIEHHLQLAEARLARSRAQSTKSRKRAL